MTPQQARELAAALTKAADAADAAGRDAIDALDALAAADDQARRELEAAILRATAR